MEGAKLIWVPVRGREINGDVQIDLAATEDVLEEVDCPPRIERDNICCGLACLKFWALLELTHLGHDRSEQLVVPVGHRSVEVDFDGLLGVLVAEQCRVYRQLAPALPAIDRLLEFGFVDRLVLARAQLLPNEEEEVTGACELARQLKHRRLSRLTRCHLLSGD